MCTSDIKMLVQVYVLIVFFISAQQTTTTAKGTTVPPHGQHFDGASFVGGMILMGGLIAIAYFALKFYRVRKDRSYRTL